MALTVKDVGKQPVTEYLPDGTTRVVWKDCVDYHATGKDVQALRGMADKGKAAKAQYEAALQRKWGNDRLSIPGQPPVTQRADLSQMMLDAGLQLGAGAFSIRAPSLPWNEGRGRRSGRFKAIYRNGEREVVVDTLKEDA